MTKERWHTLRDEDCVTVTRRLPARFDVEAETVLPGERATRLAHLVRQDLWRELQRLRGFSPVVEVRRAAGKLHVRAGGTVDGRYPADTVAQIAALLSEPEKRARWIKGAANA